LTTGLDKVLFESLFKQYFEPLCAFAKSYVYDLEASKDIVQKAFINLWNNKEKIDSDKPVKSYIYTSVRNLCLNYIRDNKKFKSQILDFDTVDENLFTAESDALEVDELQIKIDNAISALPDKSRQIFEMSRFEDLKYRQIAEKLGISVKSVEAHMTKALKALKVDLEAYIVTVIVFLYFFNS